RIQAHPGRAHVALVEVDEIGEDDPLHRVQQHEQAEIGGGGVIAPGGHKTSALTTGAPGSRPWRRPSASSHLAFSGSGPAWLRRIVSSTGYSTRFSSMRPSSMSA